MTIRRLASAATVLAVTGVGLVLGGPAQAQEYEPEKPITATQASCGQGGEVTITIADHPYLVSSGVKTAGLAVRVGGEVTYTEPTDHANGEHVADESITVGPFAAPTTVEYRWFAGPERGGDLPPWDLSGDWVAVVEALEADTGRHWNAGDSADFIGWFEFDAYGCVTPDEPTVELFDCATDSHAGELVIPEQDGVVYDAESGPVAPGTYEVSAEPAEGYEFPAEATTTWDLTVPPVNGCPGEDGDDGQDGEPGGTGGSDDGDGGDKGGELAQTGSPAQTAAVAGGGLLALGGSLAGLSWLWNRRRRNALLGGLAE